MFRMMIGRKKTVSTVVSALLKKNLAFYKAAPVPVMVPAVRTGLDRHIFSGCRIYTYGITHITTAIPIVRNVGFGYHRIIRFSRSLTPTDVNGDCLRVQYPSIVVHQR